MSPAEWMDSLTDAQRFALGAAALLWANLWRTDRLMRRVRALEGEGAYPRGATDHACAALRGIIVVLAALTMGAALPGAWEALS